MDVLKIAKLAQLSLSADEQIAMQNDLNSIFKWIDALKNVKGEEEQIPSQPVMHEREDISKKTPNPDVLLANAPQQAYGMFSVPKVVESV